MVRSAFPAGLASTGELDRESERRRAHWAVLGPFIEIGDSPTVVVNREVVVGPAGIVHLSPDSAGPTAG
ncbi:MAG: hypothetical protein CL908_15380 [Deltaproteobacteria bacterium]|nr:hypothetical protein [Deltaproteobacteria bacterium]